MTIKRIINGVEIEIKLTEDELSTAYFAQQYMWDLQSCKEYFHTMYACEEWYKVLDEETETNIIEDAATELRRNIRKYDMDFEDAIVDAFNEVISNYIEEVEE